MGAVKTPFIVHRRVEFADTDLSGIAHFSRYFIFMETAEHAFRQALGFEVHTEVEGVAIGWPRVHAECDYKSPLRFGDEVAIAVAVSRRGRSSLTFSFELSVEERLVARGELASVCCRVGGESLELVPIPEPLAAAIDALEPRSPA